MQWDELMGYGIVVPVKLSTRHSVSTVNLRNLRIRTEHGHSMERRCQMHPNTVDGLLFVRG